MQVSTSSSGAAVEFKQTNVSKSDQQLFGAYAPIVRQLGIAADACQQATELMLFLSDSSLAEVGSDTAEKACEAHFENLLKRLNDLRDDASRKHRYVAEQALISPDWSAMRDPRDVDGSA